MSCEYSVVEVLIKSFMSTVNVIIRSPYNFCQQYLSFKLGIFSVCVCYVLGRGGGGGRGVEGITLTGADYPCICIKAVMR